MAIPFSAGDLIAVAQLAYKVSLDCINAPADYQSLGILCRHIHNAIECCNPNDSGSVIRKQDQVAINCLAQCIKDTMTELEIALDKYGTTDALQGFGNRIVFMFSKNEWEDYRKQLKEHVDLLNLAVSGATLGAVNVIARGGRFRPTLDDKSAQRETSVPNAAAVERRLRELSQTTTIPFEDLSKLQSSIVEQLETRQENPPSPVNRRFPPAGTFGRRRQRSPAASPNMESDGGIGWAPRVGPIKDLYPDRFTPLSHDNGRFLSQPSMNATERDLWHQKFGYSQPTHGYVMTRNEVQSFRHALCEAMFQLSEAYTWPPADFIAETIERADTNDDAWWNVDEFAEVMRRLNMELMRGAAVWRHNWGPVMTERTRTVVYSGPGVLVVPFEYAVITTPPIEAQIQAASTERCRYWTTLPPTPPPEEQHTLCREDSWETWETKVEGIKRREWDNEALFC